MYDFRIPKKYIFIAIGSAIGILSIVFVGNLVYENILPKKLKIAAGKDDGDSHIISHAIAKVVEDKTWNIEIDVCQTDGTDDNLKAIEGKELEGTITCESGEKPDKIDLATAQGDRLALSMSVRSIATLYEDNVQLLIKPENLQINPETIEKNFDFSKLNNKIIATPKAGGQRQSLRIIAVWTGPKGEHPQDTSKQKIVRRASII